MRCRRREEVVNLQIFGKEDQQQTSEDTKARKAYWILRIKGIGALE